MFHNEATAGRISKIETILLFLPIKKKSVNYFNLINNKIHFFSVRKTLFGQLISADSFYDQKYSKHFYPIEWMLEVNGVTSAHRLRDTAAHSCQPSLLMNAVYFLCERLQQFAWIIRFNGWDSLLSVTQLLFMNLFDDFSGSLSCKSAFSHHQMYLFHILLSGQCHYKATLNSQGSFAFGMI